MNNKESFGSFFKSLRLRLGYTLRDFCVNNSLDPGNISKLERGVLPPPQNEDKLAAYAKALDLKQGTDEWYEFFDLAYAAAGIVPSDLMNDKQVAQRLPAFFRSLRSEKISPEKLDALIERIRDS